MKRYEKSVVKCAVGVVFCLFVFTIFMQYLVNTKRVFAWEGLFLGMQAIIAGCFIAFAAVSIIVYVRAFSKVREKFYAKKSSEPETGLDMPELFCKYIEGSLASSVLFLVVSFSRGVLVNPLHALTRALPVVIYIMLVFSLPFMFVWHFGAGLLIGYVDWEVIMSLSPLFHLPNIFLGLLSMMGVYVVLSPIMVNVTSKVASRDFVVRFPRYASSIKEVRSLAMDYIKRGGILQKL